MLGCLDERDILVSTFPARMDGSIPTLSRRNGTGRRRCFIGDVVLRELSSVEDIGHGRCKLYGGRVDNGDKKNDSDEIRTRAGNPSRIEGWT